MSRRPPRLRWSTGAFTLFEVALSLALVSIGIISVLMLMPMGIKAQQLSRYQLLAAAKAIDIMSVNTNQWRKWDKQRLEASTLGANTINTVAHAPLAEQKASNWRHGCLPLPPEIARRLDSANDEISRILAEGGTLFYASPRPNSSIAEGDLVLDDRALPNESSRLVFAFIGHAQQYALVNHPLKAWPYYDWYPTPPRGRPGSSTRSSRHEDAWVLGNWAARTEFRAVVTKWQSFPPAPAVPLLSDVLAYRDLTKALVLALSMPVESGGVPRPPTGDAHLTVEPAKVLAASYVAQAMAWLTSTSFSPAPPAADMALYREEAARAHESSLAWIRRYASTNPYDWGLDRPLNFQSAWDHPLLQAELFASTAATAVATPQPGPNGDVAWRILGPRSSVTNLNCASSFPFATSGDAKASHERNVANLPLSFGDPSTFNLTAKFAAYERCRQLVFWAVDWQSYEDFEAAPSAAIDAGKFAHDSAGSVAYNNGAHKFGNPEVFFVFGNATRTTIPANQGAALGNRGIFLGIHGADRNGNGVYDRGPTPPSVRMRATVVGRFNFYNPRVWCGLKN